CMESQDDCDNINKACTKEKPYLCADGQCAASSSACSASISCEKGYEKCPDNTCVKASEYWTSCRNRNGCPFSQPFRCENGQCSATQCNALVSCPNSAPYRCMDLSCV